MQHSYLQVLAQDKIDKTANSKKTKVRTGPKIKDKSKKIKV